MSDARPVRILRMITRLNVGGPARHVMALSDGLRARGFETTLVYGSLGEDEGSLEDLIVNLKVNARKVPALGRRVRPWSDVSAFFQILRVIFREQPDIVHTHTAKAGALGRLAAWVYNLTRPRSRRCLIVHTFHGLVFNGYFGSVGAFTVIGVERFLAAISDRIITISASQKNDVCRLYHVAPDAKTEVIELGVGIDSLLRLGTDDRLRAELGVGPGEVVFSFVGRFVPIKGLPTLVRAFAMTAARVSGVRLLLVGDGELRQPLERLAAQLGVADRVHFTGWRRDLEVVYGGTDVGVLSSRSEGTPVALIETMAAGRPVVSTAVGGVTDVVAHERTGLVVTPGDVGGLAAAMERLARDSILRKKMGEAARTEVAGRFAIERLETDISRFYFDALADKGLVRART